MGDSIETTTAEHNSTTFCELFAFQVVRLYSFLGMQTMLKNHTYLIFSTMSQIYRTGALEELSMTFCIHVSVANGAKERKVRSQTNSEVGHIRKHR